MLASRFGKAWQKHAEQEDREMPPPYYILGHAVTTRVAVPARICPGAGYKKIHLPPSKYRIEEVYREEKYWHVPELSDGYTYRLRVIEPANPYYGKRVSIWQNDLADAVCGEDEL